MRNCRTSNLSVAIRASERLQQRDMYALWIHCGGMKMWSEDFVQWPLRIQNTCHRPFWWGAQFVWRFSGYACLQILQVCILPENREASLYRWPNTRIAGFLLCVVTPGIWYMYKYEYCKGIFRWLFLSLWVISCNNASATRCFAPGWWSTYNACIIWNSTWVVGCPHSQESVFILIDWDQFGS